MEFLSFFFTELFLIHTGGYIEDIERISMQSIIYHLCVIYGVLYGTYMISIYAL